MEPRDGMFGGPWVLKGFQARETIDKAKIQAKAKCELAAAITSKEEWQQNASILQCTLCADVPLPVEKGLGLRPETDRDLQWYVTSNSRTGAHITLCPACMHGEATWNILSPTMAAQAHAPIFCHEETRAEKLYEDGKNERVTREVEAELLGDSRDRDFYPYPNMRDELVVAMRDQDIVPPASEWKRILADSVPPEAALTECSQWCANTSRTPCQHCGDQNYAKGLSKRAREAESENELERNRNPKKHREFYDRDEEPRDPDDENPDTKMPWAEDLIEAPPKRVPTIFYFHHKRGVTTNIIVRAEKENDTPENAP
jgi:hypothetical protein